MSVAFDPFPSLSVQAGGQAKACTEYRGGQTCPERASNESRITNANMSPLLHMHLCSGTRVIYIYKYVQQRMDFHSCVVIGN